MRVKQRWVRWKSRYTVDPITEIASIAQEHGLWMHVDGCLGGWVLPFAREIDPSIPAFDFEVPGVTSMSADTHKYGYAVKGVSTILYVDEALKRYEGSYFEDWPSGTYATPGLAGSRTGGSIASAWAVMRYLGREGYIDNARKILAIKKRMIEGIRAIEGFEIVGEPHSFHFAFYADGFDIDAVADGIEDRDWHISRSMEPPSIQLILNQSHGPIVEAFLSDLGQVTEEVRAGRIKSRGEKAVYAV
jgi:sphinganine-1-phosphate aldolase